MEGLFGSVKDDSSNRNIELLLGVQEWRHGRFYIPYVQQIFDKFANMSDEDKIMIQNLFGFVLEEQFDKEEIFKREVFLHPLLING